MNNILAWIKGLWKDHSKGIVAALLTAAIISLLKVIFGLAWLKAGVVALADYFTAQITLARYWLLTMVALGVLVTRLLIWRANKKNIESYNMDEIQGLVWEWDYYNFHSSLKSLCPKCLAELLVKEAYDESAYLCVSCHFNKSYDFSKDVLLRLVKIEIDKRERTGDWKQAEKRIKEIKNKS
jgi:glutaredoxin